MAKRTSLTRSSSVSSASTLSCIKVVGPDSSSEIMSSQSSTPPTSVVDGGSADASSIKQESLADLAAAATNTRRPASTRRSLRAQSSAESCRSGLLPEMAYEKSGKRKETRMFSGDTLVEDGSGKDLANTPERCKKVEGEIEKALDMDWHVGSLDTDATVAGNSRHAERRGSSSLNKLSQAASKLKSSLGKRSREAVESGMDKLRGSKKRQSTRLQALEQEPADEIKVRKVESEEADMIEPANKRLKLESESVEPTTISVSHTSKSKKPYIDHGLYLGFTSDWESSAPASKSQKKGKKKEETQATKDRTFLPFMMGYKATVEGLDFKIPYDIFAPLKRKEKPKEWRVLNRNVFIDDAKDEWRVKKIKEVSACLCRTPAPGEEGCGEDCLNRTMLYECDDTNCNLPANLCTNRAFTDLTRRTKKGGEYDIGVEIINTKDRGHGIRASRAFAPGQIIIEYCGEVITQVESDRRMNEVYKDKNCYYLMEFDQGMIIDATKGNIARFVNHSCEPNCQMEKRIVKGEPKMALFAGTKGISTGDELTYDYNFDNFSQLNVLDCRCGADRCRGKLERRDAKKEKEKEKETLAASLKRKASELVDSLVPEPSERQKLKKRKTFRAIGWVYEDPTMEMQRLQEDAIEKGKSVDVSGLEVLKTRAEELKRSRSRSSSKVADNARSGSRSGSLRKDKDGGRVVSQTKTKTKTTILTETTTTTTVLPDTKVASAGSKKSLLSRAASKLSRSDSAPAKRSSLFKQTTLSFGPSSTIKTDPADIIDDDNEDADVQAVIVTQAVDEDEGQGLLTGEAGDAKEKTGGLRRSLSKGSKKILGSVSRKTTAAAAKRASKRDSVGSGVLLGEEAEA